jgi:recombinational DNA repair protein (RecF pathway)
MPINQSEAFVVNLYDYSETSRIVQFLTAQQGNCLALLRGSDEKIVTGLMP